MKIVNKRCKITVLISCFLILFGTNSCVRTPVENSESNQSNTVSESINETSIDPIFFDENFIQSEYPIDNYLNSEIDRTGDRTIISTGKPYTKSFASDTVSYTDKDNMELTNGKFAALNFDSEWTGFELKSINDMEIILDIGEITDDISDIEISLLSWIDCGITAAEYIKYSISQDGLNYIDLGTIYSKANNTGIYSEKYTIKLQKSVSARYIKAYIPKGAWWLFIDEFAVYKYISTTNDPLPEYGELGRKLYTSEPIKKVEEETLWDSTELDYEDEINLIKDQIQRVYVPIPLTDKHYLDYNNSTADCTFLTDGKKVSDIWSLGWFKSANGIERNIIYDLKKTSTVYGVNIGIAQSMEASIYPPRFIKIYLSDNGVDWECVYDYGAITGIDNSRFDFKIEFSQKYKARFICLKFGVSCFMYCDEIEVIGTKKVDDNSIAISKLGGFDTQFPDEYITPNDDIYDGANDILLAPFIRDASTSKAELTKEQWLPYVAYINNQGEIIDTMFDGVIMGEYITTFSTSGKTATALKNYIECLYKTNYNLDALDKIVGDVKKALGLNDYRIAVTVCIPTLNRGFINQDYNNDGIIEDMTTLEGLKIVTDWFMSEIEARFKAAKYENLNLDGYYWEYECIEYQKPFEIELIKYTSNKCHEKGYLLSWIPWNNACGYQEWDELRFDVACMQPNYAWYDYPKQVIEEIAAESKLLGMSVEMEIHPSAPYSELYFENYMEYLKGGITSGYMNSLNFYYQGGTPGEYYNACYGDGQYGRVIYDYTYKYIKGFLSIEDIDVSKQNVYIYTNKKYIGNLNTTGKTNIIFEIEENPLYGDIKMNSDGSFSYTPICDFEGDDKFTFSATNGFYKVIKTTTIKVRKEK